MESNRRRRRRDEQVGNTTIEDGRGDRKMADDGKKVVKKSRIDSDSKSQALAGVRTDKERNSNVTEYESAGVSSSKSSQPDVFEILSSDDEVDHPKAFSICHGRAEPSKSFGIKYADEGKKKPYNPLDRREFKQQSTANYKPPQMKLDNEAHALSSQTVQKSGAQSIRHNTKKSGQSNNENSSNKCLTDYYNKQPTLPIRTLMQQASSILKQRFGHSTLRPLQETAIQRALERTNQIIIMATGGGKSICYQLPALVGFGKQPHDCVTVVVCPLIALMIDQVRNLHKRGVMTAACLSSSQTAKEKAEIFSRLRLDKNDKKGDKNKAKSVVEPNSVQLLYVTPELIKTDKFRGVLHKLYESKRLLQIAIDEAHCVSTWGHDFRGAYKELSWLREAFPDVPIMACEFYFLSQMEIAE